MSATLDRDVAGAAAAHQRLLAHLDELAADDSDDRADVAGRPSELPGWTVGHVLTHIARNADSHVRMLDGAAGGEVADQYEGGAAGRAADIDAGSTRPLHELVDDVRTSIWILERAWAGQPTWEGSGRSASGSLIAVEDLAFRRWRETEVHHADLGLGYTIADWPAEYVRLELTRMEMLWTARRPMGMGGLPVAALAAEPHRRLAWLLGRADIDGVPVAGIFG